jgi:O-antigen/teichoic acid export membrane protein
MALHSGASLAIRLFALASSFLFAVATARLLGPSGYGIVAVAVSSVTVVSTIALLGVDGLAVRQSAMLQTRQAWGELRHFVSWAVIWVIGTSILAAAVVMASSPLFGSYSNALAVAAIVIPLLAGILLLKSIIQGLSHVVLAQVPGEIVRWILTLSLMAFLFVANLRTPEAVIVSVIAALAVSLVVAGAFLHHFVTQLPKDHEPGTHGRRLLRQASPFLAIAVFGIVGTELATLILGWLAGPREAGLYQPIAKSAPVMLLAAYSIEAALAPRIVRMWEQQDRAGLQQLMRRSAIAATLATSAITGLILLMAPVIFLAFGREFTVNVGYLYLVGAAQLANAAFGPAPLLLAMVGDMSSRLKAQVLTLIVQAALAILLIPSMGAAGAVISLTVAILTWSALHWWLAMRTTGINTLAFAWRPSTGGEKA